MNFSKPTKPRRILATAEIAGAGAAFFAYALSGWGSRPNPLYLAASGVLLVSGVRHMAGTSWTKAGAWTAGPIAAYLAFHKYQNYLRDRQLHAAYLARLAASPAAPKA